MYWVASLSILCASQIKHTNFRGQIWNPGYLGFWTDTSLPESTPVIRLTCMQTNWAEIGTIVKGQQLREMRSWQRLVILIAGNTAITAEFNVWLRHGNEKSRVQNQQKETKKLENVLKLEFYLFWLWTFFWVFKNKLMSELELMVKWYQQFSYLWVGH